MFLLSQLSIGIATERLRVRRPWNASYVRRLRKHFSRIMYVMTKENYEKLRDFSKCGCVSSKSADRWFRSSSTTNASGNDDFAIFTQRSWKLVISSVHYNYIGRFGKRRRRWPQETSNEKRLLARENWTLGQLRRACTPRVFRNFHLRTEVKCG